MSGRGKEEEVFGKGSAKGRRKILGDNIQGITKPAVRRLTEVLSVSMICSIRKLMVV